MKKKILSLLVLLVAAVSGASASYEAQIGEGTSTIGYHPFYTLYNYSISESLYLASELTEAGVEAGAITSLSWYATNEPGYAQQGISIWMANVSDTELTTSSHSSTGMTQVYTNGTMTPAIGWNEFQCNGDFSWDGTSNLLILVQRNNGEWNSTVYWQATSGLSFTCMSYRYQDSGAYDVTAPNTMYTSQTRPNIIIKGESGPAFDLTEGENEHGTITFKIGENEVTEAAEGKEVTVVVTPDEGYVVKEVTGRWYAAMAASRARRESTNPDLLKDFTPTAAGENTYTFTMKRANAELSATYKKLLTNSDITIEAIPAETYTGSGIEPAITVKDGSTVLEKDVDYTVSYSNNINAAASDATENAPTVTITAVATSENYAGETSTTFTINPAELSDDMIAAVDDQTFTGSEILPELTITFGEGENAQTLVKGTDYTVTGENNVNVGTATITATGQGNFTGTASADFTIVSKPLSDDMIGPIDDLEYTGEPLEPGLNVNYGDNSLVEGTDYTVEYADNVEAGKATVTITGIGNYEGTATANFYIGRKDLNDETIKVEYIFWEHYDGEEHTPQLTIRDGTKQLIEDKDYKVTFKENVDAGTARVTIEGLGNYKGKVKKYFAIFSYVLDEDMVQAIADQVWTGEAVTPAISVINGNMTLTEGKDFTVKFKNNVNEGTATVIVNGTGNFRSVDLVKTFKIVKKAEVEEPEPVDAPGEATAINETNMANEANGTAYDLQGRKVVGNRKGVVIIDGKLVLKK